MARLLPEGRVLVIVGPSGESTTSRAQLYDPATGSWTATASIASDPLCKATAETLTIRGADLNSIRVLVTGWTIVSCPDPLIGCSYEPRAYLYDPKDGTWSRTADPLEVREEHTLTLLPNDEVLSTGGRTPTYTTLPASEVYTPW